MRIGVTEILLILILALVVFGGGKLAGVGKSLGQSIREFKKEVKASDDDVETTSEETKPESQDPPKA
ncbi:MAG: twin-arginine translocase TatA/TatE family subunit [Eubacteriales bacterium]|nr:twin-arginine translocase TatA/TatE family subunit [Eubacteriales bacterium]